MNSLRLVQGVEQVADDMDGRRDQVAAQPCPAPGRAGPEYALAEPRRGRGGFVVVVKLQPEHRIPHRLGRRPETAAILGAGPYLDRLLHGVGVQKGDRRMAVFAFARMLEIDGGAALGAGDLTPLRPETLQLGRVQAPNELLFPQELGKGREPPVADGASKVRKSAGFAQVEALYQRLFTARTFKLARPGPARVVLVRIDFLE